MGDSFSENISRMQPHHQASAAAAPAAPYGASGRNRSPTISKKPASKPPNHPRSLFPCAPRRSFRQRGADDRFLSSVLQGLRPAERFRQKPGTLGEYPARGRFFDPALPRAETSKKKTGLHRSCFGRSPRCARRVILKEWPSGRKPFLKTCRARSLSTPPASIAIPAASLLR